MSLVGLLFLHAAVAGEADPEPTWFFGAQLAITAEPFEDGGTAVSLNVLPLVVEWAATRHVGLRATTVLNLQFAGASTGLAHRGLAMTLPVYLPGAKDTAPYQGFYVGPHAGFTTNPLVGGKDLTAAGEVGVRWEVMPRWSLNLALQAGGTWLDRPENDRWVTHFGFFPSFGAWTF
ncbi:MAG: hypothetical protein EP330_30550 [Deltaproteobacteria bacterium]|nr:MAG: hypothetical protein EP330_30550 [Deltaproteobacteria bacterium]